MIYFKSAMAGIVAALAGVMLWLLATLILPVFVPLLLSRVSPSQGGIGASSGFVDSGSLLVAALVCFGIGFYWTFRRGARRQRQG
jgi:uncharacterized RDD family membrane protein YckC